MTTNGTMPNSSKKRKASELDSSPAHGTSKSKAPNRPKARKRDTKAVEEIPFAPECPYTPSNDPDDDVFVQREQIAPGFEFDYGVRPGLQWKSMRSYRNVKLQEHTFSVGSIIYINKQNPPPKSPRSDATDAEILKYDRTNFWVGRIADTRAESDKAVFLRVFWLYWPEELPMGRQPYHGDRELVLSNAMDIVDAQTISGEADLMNWDEQEPTHLTSDRFWRQTFDISKLGKDRKGGLSELRKHCKCQQPHNPDKTMFQCKRPSCMTWNHQDCLAKDAVLRAWPTYEKDGNLDNFANIDIKPDEDEGETSLRQRLFSPVRHLGKMMQNSIRPSVDVVVEQSNIHTTGEDTNGHEARIQKGRPPKKARSQTPASQIGEGKLKADIFNKDEKDDESPVVARIHETGGKKTKSESRSWNIPVKCLVCGLAM